MKKNVILLALAAVGLASCNGGFKKAPHGVLYNINTDKSGPNIKLGDYVVMNLVLKNDADSVLVSSYDIGHPFAFPLTQQQPGDLFDVFPMLSEGDSVNIKVTMDSLYKSAPKPPTLTGKYMNYSVKVEKVISKGSLSDQDFSAKVGEYMKGVTEKYKAQEPGKIQKYIADNKLTLTKTASGLQYVITKPGVGPTPSKGDTVYVNYIGRFTDGKVFETNIKEEAAKAKKMNPMMQYQPIALPIGMQRVIPGWDEGLMLLNKGAKATFVIPSELAYGEHGNQMVGPFTPLVFEVEMVNFKKGDPNAPAPNPMMPNMKVVPPPTTKK
jgi:FKBP-type peptidyl-prolyl cis-trans isomerase FkpA